MRKYFHSFFGSNENFKICFQDLLTFSEPSKVGENLKTQITRIDSFWVNKNQTFYMLHCPQKNMTKKNFKKWSWLL